MKIKKLAALAMALVTAGTTFLATGTESKAYYYNWHAEKTVATLKEYTAIEKDTTQWISGAATYRNGWAINATGYCVDMVPGYDLYNNQTHLTESGLIMAMREKGSDFFVNYDPNGILQDDKGRHYTCYSNAELQLILSNGWMTEWMDEFKAYGWLDQAYTLPAGVTNQNAPAEKKWTLTTDYEAYQEWGVKASNVKSLIARDGAVLRNDCLPMATAITAIPAGTPLTVLGRTYTDFYVIQLPDGQTGYLDAYYTALPSPVAN